GAGSEQDLCAWCEELCKDGEIPARRNSAHRPGRGIDEEGRRRDRSSMASLDDIFLCRGFFPPPGGPIKHAYFWMENVVFRRASTFQRGLRRFQNFLYDWRRAS